jgi:hypothetical protein
MIYHEDLYRSRLRFQFQTKLLLNRRKNRRARRLRRWSVVNAPWWLPVGAWFVSGVHPYYLRVLRYYHNSRSARVFLVCVFALGTGGRRLFRHAEAGFRGVKDAGIRRIMGIASY